MSCFSKNILDYFYNIQNTGRILKPEAIGRAGSKQEGTVIEFSWRVKDSIITDARFRTFGDVNAIAISSIVTTMMTGKSVDEVLSIRPEDILEQLRETKPNYLYLIDLSLLALENTYNNFSKKNIKQTKKHNKLAESLRSDLSKIKSGELINNDNLNLGDFDVFIDDEQNYLNNLGEYNSYIEKEEDEFNSLFDNAEQNSVAELSRESRGRGRPRKEKSIEELEAELNKVSRGRGRPRKERTEEELLALQNKVSRGRGRPRKERTPEELEAELNKVSRGLGRPRKDETAIEVKPTSYLSSFGGGFINKLNNNQQSSINTNIFYSENLEDDIYDDEFDKEIDNTERDDIYTLDNDFVEGTNEEQYTPVFDNEEAEVVGNISRGRGRPRKERTPEELEKLNAPKGKRGRPRKERSEEELLALENKVSRGRGRPRKEPLVENDTQSTISRGRGRPRKERTPEELEAELNKVSRGRGRPKKERTPEEIEKLNAPKGKRGRPRKENNEQFINNYNNGSVQGDDFVLPKKQIFNQSTLDFVLNNNNIEEENTKTSFENITFNTDRNQTETLRGRGRPRKERTPEEIEAELNKVSRGRGRPKKERTEEELEAQLNKVSRGRGRPKKESTLEDELEKQNAPKGKRGRPKKDTAFVIQSVKPMKQPEEKSDNIQEIEQIQPVVETMVEEKPTDNYSEVSYNKQVVEEENEYITPSSSNSFAPAQNKYGVGTSSMYRPTITKTVTTTTTTNYTFNEKKVTTLTSNHSLDEVEDDEIEVEKVENKTIDKPNKSEPAKDNKMKTLKELMEEEDEEPTNVSPLSENINNILSGGGTIQDALKALLDD